MRRPHISVLVRVSAAHFISHVYIMLVPALLPLLPAALGVSYVELGVAVSLFGILSAVLQAPMGFVVDRFGARRVLLVGIAVGTSCCFFLTAFPSYKGLLVATSVLGAANAVYHPSDYAILSRSVKDAVMGRAFSLHSFAGFGGSAITPFLMITIATFCGLPSAFFTAGLLGIATLGLFFLTRSDERDEGYADESASSEKNKSGVQMAVFTIPIFLLTLMYVLLSLSTTSIERFSVSALIEGFETPLSLANMALTAFLLFSAIGVLSGGALADRTRKHGYVAASAFGIAAVLAAIVALGILPPFALVPFFALIGFLTGIIVPSRDMLVRAASPKGGEGKTFGIVSCGFNIGGTVGPLMCGYFLDHGMPAYVFWAAVVFMVLTVLLTSVQERLKTQ